MPHVLRYTSLCLHYYVFWICYTGLCLHYYVLLCYYYVILDCCFESLYGSRVACYSQNGETMNYLQFDIGIRFLSLINYWSGSFDGRFSYFSSNIPDEYVSE